MDRNDPQLRAAVRRSNEAKKAAVADIRALTASIKRSHAQFKAEAAGRRTEREEANRRGDNGPDVQRVQQRVDRGETTWDAVRNGSDDHPSSIRVRQMITANLDQLGEVMARDPEMAEQQRDLDLRNAELERLRDPDGR
ncbi:hypothetical protein GCM10011376_01750 [Nocardioides flavus (ex Wang et al. 2016)]|uniref:Uncharacterized protein n=1 Tax=Nocardioides flavus (ex Wang et al. 2016) TaxID=2058780 RepID=A0ABQ3HET7_9ACTN|nr:hypothetical protein [Nocardioides flavus (ex Wang et al. 2016)]GHE15108.1 hypothetical protein GCM10011376_01750 [Nocardioides flavus (ex Wang et al. 2016)]